MVHVIAEVVSHWLPAVEAGFHTGLVQLGFMLDSLAMGQGVLQILCISPVTIIPLMLYSHTTPIQNFLDYFHHLSYGVSSEYFG
jgi:hypothetical protein